MSQTNLFEFLKNHIVTVKGDPITHTRIGATGTSGECPMGGKYFISADDKPEFYRHYYNAVFKNHQKEYLTEVQLHRFQDGDEPCGPLLIDMDFRYNSCDLSERNITIDLITDILGLYTECLNELFAFKEDDTYPIYVMMKKNINRIDELTKDGIHIIFGIQMDHILQQELRRMIMPKLEELLDLNGDNPYHFINKINDILDEGISKGHTNWQMYGSKKPNHEPYELIKYYLVSIHEEDDEIVHQLQAKKINKFFERKEKAIELLSAQYTHHIQFVLKNPEKYQQLKGKVHKPENTVVQTQTISIMKSTFNFDVTEIGDIETLNKLIDVMFSGMKREEYSIIEVHHYTMGLNEDYSNDYNKWIRVGWALHNTDHRLFLTWMAFSAKSSKFSFSDIGRYYEMWNTEMTDEGLSGRSIMYWLKQDDIAKYKEIKYKSIEYYMEETISCSNEYDLALVLFHLYKDQYRCADIKNKVWYEYKNHRWQEIDSGFSLRLNISKELSKLYSDKSDKILNELIQKSGASPADMELALQGDAHSVAETEATVEKDASQLERLRKLSQKYNDISKKLKQSAFKNNVMREAADLFYKEEPKFYEKLDTKPHLLCFNNGVFDFAERCFRQGRPDDYVSMSTNINYVEYKPEVHTDISGEIHEFMGKLFPRRDLCEYMWQHLASTLIGVNKNQTFNIYNGRGSNGKSKLVELMSRVLGDYKAVVPISLVTSKRGGVGSATPEIAALKGIRYAVMQEPSKNDPLNDGMIKELTGEDYMTGRELYKSPITFKPQFKLVVCTNNLFDIKTNDDGTWRRICLCSFMSKFVDNPDKRREEDPSGDTHYFQIDKEMDEKLQRWTEIFMSMLVEKVLITNGNVDECEIVMEASNNYRNKQDYLAQFVSECLKRAADGFMSKKELSAEFKNWCSNSNNGHHRAGKELEEYMDKQFTRNILKQGWDGCRLHDIEEPESITATGEL
jgi:P4 family phage/plasmid primase-like protien